MNADGHGRDEIRVGKLGGTECARECRKRSQTNTQINGATVRKSDGMCWCEVAMDRKVTSSYYNTCYLKGEFALTIARSVDYEMFRRYIR